MTQKKSLPAPIVEPAAPGGALEVFRQVGGGAFRFCTLPCDSVDLVRAISAELARPCARLIDAKGKTLQVVHLIGDEGEEEDPETGEVGIKCRLHLITADGTRYSTPSPYARRSLWRQLERVARIDPLRLPPYDPPIRVEVRLEPSRDPDKLWLNLIVLPDLPSPLSGVPREGGCP